MRLRAWPCLLVLLCCWCELAGAQGAEPPGDAASAQRAFEDGVAFAREARWPEAIEAFRESNALLERPSTLFNLALALHNGGQPAEALNAVERFETLSGADLTPEDRAQVHELRAATEPRAARLTLTVQPPAATVRVDGAVLTGDAGRYRLWLSAGQHAVRVVAVGHDDLALTLRLEAGDRIERGLQLSPERPSRKTAGAAVPTPRATAAAAPTPDGAPGALDGRATPAARHEGSLTSEPWFWIALGAVLTSGAVTAGVLLLDQEPDPTPTTSGLRL